MLIDNTLRSLLNILIYLALIAAIIPWFLIVIPVSAVVFIPLYYVFRAGARELQRLQLMSTSPLLSHVDASLRGVASIRAYDMIGDFETRSKIFFIFLKYSWLSQKPEFIGNQERALFSKHITGLHTGSWS